jgi:hypothetical protein
MEQLDLAQVTHKPYHFWLTLYSNTPSSTQTFFSMNISEIKRELYVFNIFSFFLQIRCICFQETSEMDGIFLFSYFSTVKPAHVVACI